MVKTTHTPLPFRERLKRYWQSYRSLKGTEKLGALIIFLLAGLAPFVPSAGWDFLAAYRTAVLTGNYGVNTWNPYPTYWLLYPFAILPPLIGYLLWNLFTAVCVIAALKFWRGPFLMFALSLPGFWLFYLGQLEGVMALGLVLASLSSPWAVGLGLTLLTVKPQIGLFPIVFVLLRRRNWRDLLVPGLVYGLSFLYWGWWIPEWLAALPNPADRPSLINIDFWPYSLVLLPILWWKRSDLKIWLIEQSAIMPYSPVYSLSPLFTMFLPIWINVLIWLLFLPAIFTTYPIPGFLIPLGLLLSVLLAGKKGRFSAWLR